MSNPSPGVDPATFTPTQELLLDVLAARFRLGENLWTFGSHLRKAAEQLAARGLVFTTHGITEHTIRVGLTEKGRAATLDPGYQPRAAVRHLTQEQLRRGLEQAEIWSDGGYSESSRSYWQGMRDTLRVILGVTTQVPGVSVDDAAAFTLLGGRR